MLAFANKVYSSSWRNYAVQKPKMLANANLFDIHIAIDFPVQKPKILANANAMELIGLAADSCSKT